VLSVLLRCVLLFGYAGCHDPLVGEDPQRQRQEPWPGERPDVIDPVEHPEVSVQIV
jgi:hypothetical protein